MTSSDMQDTPAGRRAARADGPRSSQPKRRTFTAAYKLAMIEKYDAATEPGAKGALLRGEGLYDSHISYWRKAPTYLLASAAIPPSDPLPPGQQDRRPRLPLATPWAAGPYPAAPLAAYRNRHRQSEAEITGVAPRAGTGTTRPTRRTGTADSE
jgi:hypothetical protein